MGTKDYKITARIQKGWNWMVAVYLFLGGLGAGAYVVGAIAGFIGWAEVAKVGVILSLPAVVVGTFFLLAHLGTPLHAYLTPSKIATSWISRGVIFISFFCLFSFIHIIMLLTGAGGAAVKFVAILGILSALGTMVYTGALLSAAKGVPFWETGIMPILFMFSALVSGLFAVLVITYIGFSGSVTEVISAHLAWAALGLLIGEAVVLFFFLYAAYQIPDAKDSVSALLKKPSFTFGDLIIGLLVPILLMLLVIVAKGGGATPAMMIIAGIAALIGALMMRFGIITVGMRSSFNMSGFEFRLQVRKDPKVLIGKVPPGNI